MKNRRFELIGASDEEGGADGATNVYTPGYSCGGEFVATFPGIAEAICYCVWQQAPGEVAIVNMKMGGAAGELPVITFAPAEGVK